MHQADTQDAVPPETQREKADIMTILNEWPQERLMEIRGIGPVLATKIIQHRPYASEEELIASKRLPPNAIVALRNAS